MSDATFEDGAYKGQPLRLAVESAEDVPVASALIQDAVGTIGEISWMPRRRRVVILLNRFRWEDRSQSEDDQRRGERVRSALIIDGVLAMRGRGIDPSEREMVYALLSISFVPGEDGDGTLTLLLAGDGDLALTLECIDMRLVDLTQPWEAKGAPSHDLE